MDIDEENLPVIVRSAEKYDAELVRDLGDELGLLLGGDGLDPNLTDEEGV